ncbi:hypothetical protein [Solwaraspora sp. WMMD792]|uniref:hypothetical protein n=1 Tax=Solwaraspora sp. WMMD792 TaxID=3016099 RepID=UPI002417CDE3|nr:hypothetical protein [Solwaraspora sp. WMMD792]MDG4774865.1 hypothetical protein [Solwaraspora sp. WMMD792]
MRHLGSLILSLLLAPVIWFLAGLGLSEYALARRDAYSEPPLDVFIGLAALAVCGVSYALLLLPRLSPVGPVLAGASFVAVSVWATVDIVGFYDTMPRRLLGTDFVLTAPAEGLAVVLAVPLLATVFSPRRWRGERMVALYAGGPPPQDVTRTAPLPGPGGYGNPGGYGGNPGGYGGNAGPPAWSAQPPTGDPARTIAFPAAANPPLRPARSATGAGTDSEHDTMRLTPPGHRRDDPTVVLPQASAFAPPRPAVTGGDPDETTRISQPTTTDPDETTRISQPTTTDPDETTRISQPTTTDPDETTRISQPTTTDPDETTRISQPTDGPDGGDETTTVLPARPDDAGKSPS